MTQRSGVRVTGDGGGRRLSTSMPSRPKGCMVTNTTGAQQKSQDLGDVPSSLPGPARLVSPSVAFRSTPSASPGVAHKLYLPEMVPELHGAVGQPNSPLSNKGMSSLLPSHQQSSEDQSQMSVSGGPQVAPLQRGVCPGYCPMCCL